MNDNPPEWPILETKCHPPEVPPDFVARPTVETILEAGFASSLTLVSAPAGYGKSTIASHWTRNGNAPFAWVSLGPADNDPRQFVSYIAHALTMADRRGDTLVARLLKGDHVPTPEDMAHALAADAEKLTQRCILVLDDFHLITDPVVMGIVENLLRHPLPKLHILLLTRWDPAIRIGRMRMRNQLREIRQRDLEFSVEDVEGFMVATGACHDIQDVARRIRDDLDGWPAGIRLACLAARDQSNMSEIMRGFDQARGTLQDYLLGKVMSSLAEGFRSRLLLVSILDRFNAQLCETVWSAGGLDVAPGDGQRFLDDLKSSGLFYVPLDAGRTWYRFHHLFQSVLAEQLRARSDAADLKPLHVAAADWLQKTGNVEEAISQRLAAGDVEGAAALVGEERHRCMNADQWLRLERWLGLFSPGDIQNTTELMVLKCWLDLNLWYQPDRLYEDLQAAHGLLAEHQGDPEHQRQLAAELAAVESGLTVFMLNLERCKELCDQALSILPDDRECARSTAVLMKGAAILAGDGAAPSLDFFFERFRPDTFHHRATTSRYLQGMCFVHWCDANSRGLESVAMEMKQQGEEARENFVESFGRYFLGLSYLDGNRIDAAVEMLEPVVSAPHSYPMQNLSHCGFVLAECHQILGHSDRADAIAEMTYRSAVSRANRLFIGQAEAFRAYLDLLQGRTSAAYDWYERLDDGPPLLKIRDFQIDTVAARIALSRVELDPDDARARLAEYRRRVEGTHNRRLSIDAALLMACLEQRCGNPGDALNLVGRAVSLALPGRIVRPFSLVGADLLPLVSKLELDPDGVEFVGEIVSSLMPVPEGQGVHGAAPDSPLSRRETEIVVKFAEGLTNKEIAERLGISPGTVKRHAHNIYEKLSVGSRREAIAKARGMGLVSL